MARRWRAFARLELCTAPRRILLLAPERLEDLVAATPVLAAMVHAFEGAEKQILLTCGGEELLRSGELEPFLQARPEPGFDLAVLFASSWRSAWRARRLRARRRLGYAGGGRGWLLSDRVQPLRCGAGVVPHARVRSYADLAGLCGVEVRDLAPRLGLDRALEARVEELLAAQGIDRCGELCLIALGEAVESLLTWPGENLAALIEHLALQRGFQVYLHGGPGWRAEMAALRRTLPPGAAVAGFDLEPLGHDLLKVLVERASLVVSLDPLVRQIAAAFEVPAVVLVGSADARFQAANLERAILLRAELDCGPCGTGHCGLDGRCVHSVGSAQVIAACERLLAIHSP